MLAVIGALAALVTGCGNGEHRVPVACLEGASQVRAALVNAPGEVRFPTGTRLSECFNRAAQPAEVQEVGAIFVTAAGDLAGGARANPHSVAAIRLGYLIGAVRRGAGHTQGIHYETQRRIEQELIGVQVTSAQFVRGERAGERTG